MEKGPYNLMGLSQNLYSHRYSNIAISTVVSINYLFVDMLKTCCTKNDYENLDPPQKKHNKEIEQL